MRFLPVKPYLETEADAAPNAFALFGAPFDATASFRPGSRNGPAGLRQASEGIETYCPIRKKDLEEIAHADLGDLELPMGDTARTLEIIRKSAEDIHGCGFRPFLLGGEHLVTLPVVQSLADKHPDLCVLQFDAHADLREDYLGVRLSHACVMRRVLERLNKTCLFQAGIRSGTREEWSWMESGDRLYEILPKTMEEIAFQIDGRPVYLTVDIDVLDPSVCPGTGTPEPGGATFVELDRAFHALESLHVVGMDLVELAPDLDPTGVSSVVAAKLVRSMLLSFG